MRISIVEEGERGGEVGGGGDDEFCLTKLNGKSRALMHSS